MTPQYVVIRFNEDGDPASVEQMSGDTLRERLKEGYWGERPKFAHPGSPIHESFVGLVIVRGEIIEPRPVQVATEYDL